VPQIATVGLVGGVWDNGAIGAEEELASHPRNLLQTGRKRFNRKTALATNRKERKERIEKNL